MGIELFVKCTNIKMAPKTVAKVPTMVRIVKIVKMVGMMDWEGSFDG
jgi:hypothetical protein